MALHSEKEKSALSRIGFQNLLFFIFVLILLFLPRAQDTGFLHFGVPVMLFIPFAIAGLIFLVRTFNSFITKRGRLKKNRTKARIFLFHLGLTVATFLLFLLAHTFKIPADIAFITEFGWEADETQEQGVTVYLFENMAYAVFVLGHISFWVHLLLKERLKEYNFSLRLFPLFFCIMYFIYIYFSTVNRPIEWEEFTGWGG
jgi:hypothetical protein